MKNYTIEKIDRNVKMRGKDQDGNEQEIKVTRYTIKIEGINRTLDLLIRADLDVPAEEVIEGAVAEALKSLPADFKETKI